MLYANGFGNVSSPIIKGAPSQSGDLPSDLVILISGLPAIVQFSGLVAPGLYQFNLLVPESESDGDNTLVARYNGQSTQSGVLLTVAGSHAPTIRGLNFSSSSVSSSHTVQGTVTLSSAAPIGGVNVILSSDSAALAIPSSVIVAGGSFTASFTATAEAVTSTRAVSITAASTGSLVNATVTVTPYDVRPPSLAALQSTTALHFTWLVAKLRASGYSVNPGCPHGRRTQRAGLSPVSS